MGSREPRDETDAEESTTLVHPRASVARIKAAADLPELPTSALQLRAEPVKHNPGPHASPASDEFIKASVVVPVSPPVASSGMVGPYHLALEIASGGMATVYLAVHGLEGFQNTVAVKRIHPHLAKDKEFVDMFVDEAHIAARINHPYVCRVFDFGKSGESYYIAMEYLRGEPLSRVFKALTPDRIGNARHPTIIARVIANLAEGLHAAHTLKDTQGVGLDVVHRDVTPQNLFVLCDGTVRVTDFGIARARVRSHQTQGGRIKGKLSYMSPEQLNQQPVDCRSDIWGLGVVTWELLTGRRLFRATSEGETVLSVLSRPIPPPSRFADNIPRQLDDIVLRALSREPETRFSSARQLARALESFLAASGDTVPTMDVADWVEALFPEAGSRSDGLVRLAHAVIPPERRSTRPKSIPAASRSVAPIAPPDAARPGTKLSSADLALVSASPGSDLRWGRALLLTSALLASVASVAVLGSRWKHTAHAAPTPHAPTHDSVSGAALAALAAVAPANSAAVSAPASAPAISEGPPVSAPVSASSAKSAPPPPSVPASRSVKASGTRHAVADASSANTAAPPGPQQTGSVQLITKNGRAEVYLGSQRLGVTPLVLDLPPGTVSLVLKPLGGGEAHNVTVAIQNGATAFIAVPLTAPAPVHATSD